MYLRDLLLSGLNFFTIDYELTCSAWYMSDIKYQVLSSYYTTFQVAHWHRVTRSLLRAREWIIEESNNWIKIQKIKHFIIYSEDMAF